MCSPEAVGFIKAGAGLVANMQQAGEIAYQNRLNLYKHHQTVQQTKEGFQSTMGGKAAELMQMSEAYGQEISAVHAQTIQAASSVAAAAGESETTGPSVFAAIDEAFVKEARVVGAIERERGFAEHAYWMTGGIEAERASRQAEASWTPPQPQPSGLLMMLNFMGDFMSGHNQGTEMGLGQTAVAGGPTAAAPGGSFPVGGSPGNYNISSSVLGPTSQSWGRIQSGVVPNALMLMGGNRMLQKWGLGII